MLLRGVVSLKMKIDVVNGRRNARCDRLAPVPFNSFTEQDPLSNLVPSCPSLPCIYRMMVLVRYLNSKEMSLVMVNACFDGCRYCLALSRPPDSAETCTSYT
jgi:hypothetical protein